MEHANVKVLRDAYAAFAGGDIAVFLGFCTPEITFEFPGAGVLAGRHTKAEFLAKLGPAMEAVANTLHEEPLHFHAGDEHGFVVVAQRAERDGTQRAWTCVHWWRIRGGRLAEFHELIDDPIAYEATWHR